MGCIAYRESLRPKRVDASIPALSQSSYVSVLKAGCRILTADQVLPLSEEGEPSGDDSLFKMEDVKIEVMRARGAGGQVL